MLAQTRFTPNLGSLNLFLCRGESLPKCPKNEKDLNSRNIFFLAEQTPGKPNIK